MVDIQKINSIFYPEYISRVTNCKAQNLSFIQYTSADAARSIILNKEVWLRNARSMNDYSEVQHGIRCLVDAFKHDNHGLKLRGLLDEMFPGFINRFIKIFDSWIPEFEFGTYLSCISEHPDYEDEYGRLSMWRAYGGKNPVAIVLNPETFFTETDVFQAYTNPVHYRSQTDFIEDFGGLVDRIEAEKDYIQTLDKEYVISTLFDVFKTYAICLKHPGFVEEREWRISYIPGHRSSKYVIKDTVSIDGVPQIIHKIPIKDIPEENFTGVDIPTLIKKVIIGPSDNATLLRQSFIDLLESEGCKDAPQRVTYSGVPLR